MACPVGCAECNSAADSCTSCISGYRLGSVTTTRCFKSCTFPCLTCVEGEPTNCLSCTLGYKFEGGSCVPNTDCSATASCTVCPFGFRLSGGVCS